MLVRTHSFAIDRGNAAHVDVELDVRAGLPGLALVGLAGGAARDVRERVQAAVLNSGFSVPRRRVTVNVAPATRRGGSEFDLAVACCLLAATGELDPPRLASIGLCGELGLGGALRGCAAPPAAAEAARAIGLTALIISRSDWLGARTDSGVAVVGLRTLREVVAVLTAPAGEMQRALRPRERGRVGAGARCVGLTPRSDT